MNIPRPQLLILRYLFEELVSSPPPAPPRIQKRKEETVRFYGHSVVSHHNSFGPDSRRFFPRTDAPGLPRDGLEVEGVEHVAERWLLELFLFLHLPNRISGCTHLARLWFTRFGWGTGQGERTPRLAQGIWAWNVVALVSAKGQEFAATVKGNSQNCTCFMHFTFSMLPRPSPTPPTPQPNAWPSAATAFFFFGAGLCAWPKQATGTGFFVSKIQGALDFSVNHHPTRGNSSKCG